MLRGDLRRVVHVAALVGLACACLLAWSAAARAVTVPAGFEQAKAIGGLEQPTDVEIAANGRVFVAEKSGIIKTFTSVSDTSATVLADLRTQVHNYSDRGLLGLAVDPAFPANPYLYAYYTADAPIGGTPPVFGQAGQTIDSCPGNIDVINCVVSARVSRLRVNGELMEGPEQVLLNDWCQQFSFHAGGGIDFGADGYLYVSAGDGARWGTWDYGQLGNPTNACGDPPGGVVGDVMSPPTAEGGRLRSQDLRTSGDPLGLGGSLIRIDPATGAGAPGNPRAVSANANERRMLAYGFRNATRLAVRPGSNDVWVADWGGGYWEEINRVPQPGDPIRNFGWPCYEGGLDAHGVPYARVRPRSDDQGLSICEDLYAEGTATSAPYYAYDHELQVVPGETCSIDESAGEPGGKIWALGFYPATGNFPAAYRGALFFGDELRECMWAMLPGEDGLPDRNRVVNFVQAAASPMDIEAAPNGDLLWIDEDASNVKRVRWVGNPANRAPTAAVQADSTSGARPLTVHFSGAGSTDPDGDVLTYQWDLDGDGALDDSTARSPTFTYSTRGTYNVTLRVTDTTGASDTDTAAIVVTSGPIAKITAPATSTTWKAGDTISFAGSASDAEDGDLAPDALDWVAVLRHCSAPGSCHEHPLAEAHDVDSGSFTAPDHADPAAIDLRLTATDSGGETDTKTLTLQPRTAQLTLDTSPAGAQVTVDGQTQTAPYTKAVVANSTSTISAPATQAIAGVNHRFAAWSDGQARTHAVKVPTTGASQVATLASTAPGITQTLTFAPEADALVERLNPSTNFGAVTRLDSDRSNSHEAESYLRFLVGGLSGSVTSAKLRLRASSNTVDGPGAYGTSSEWEEGTITWSDKPAPTTALLSDSGPIASGEWIEWDVTQAVRADGPHSFRLASAVSDGVSFNSREVTTVANRPQLVVTFANVGYPRPKGASPVRFPLVVAFDECTAPNAQHGPPLAHPACTPPVQSSQELTVGSPDANLAAANATGVVVLDVMPGNPATTADDADVRMHVAVTDVRRRADLADYTGALQARPTIRVTDNPDGAATIADVALPVDVPCAATPAAAVGAACSVQTTLDTLYPGLIAEGTRTIWELGRIEVLDGGQDANTATPGNGVFLRSGIYVP